MSEIGHALMTEPKGELLRRGARGVVGYRVHTRWRHPPRHRVLHQEGGPTMRTRTALSLVVVAIPLLIGAGSPSPSTPPAATPEYVKDYNNGVKAQERKEYQDAVRWYQKALAVKPD